MGSIPVGATTTNYKPLIYNGFAILIIVWGLFRGLFLNFIGHFSELYIQKKTSKYFIEKFPKLTASKNVEDTFNILFNMSKNAPLPGYCSIYKGLNYFYTPLYVKILLHVSDTPVLIHTRSDSRIFGFVFG